MLHWEAGGQSQSSEVLLLHSNSSRVWYGDGGWGVLMCAPLVATVEQLLFAHGAVQVPLQGELFM